MEVARLANCNEFAEKLPDKWNTNIGENGCELSGGERQRISIARVFLNGAPIILLDEANRDKHFVDAPVEYLFELLGYEDAYPSDSFVLYVEGYSCAIESETLYKALRALPEKQRKVLLLNFWCDRTDVEIAKEMEVTMRTVYNLRQRAYDVIKRFYEKEN